MKFAVLKCLSTGGVTPAYSCHKIARMSEAFGEVLHSITHESLPFNFLPAARYEHAGLHVHFVLPFFLLPSFEKAQRSI